MTKEIWKQVVVDRQEDKDFFKDYEISNHGRLRRNYKTTPTRIIKPIRMAQAKYLACILSTNGIQQQYYIHRLVGLAFIPNPNNLETIDHINEDKTNNRVENLQWMSNFDNNRKGHIDPNSLSNKCCRLYEQHQEIQNHYKNGKSFQASVRRNSKPALKLFNKYQ